MDFSRFAAGLQSLVEKTPLFGNKDLETVLVINAKAGGFTKRVRMLAALSDIHDVLEESANIKTRKGKTLFRTAYTIGPKHAGGLAAAYAEEAAMKPNAVWLIIIASGDGTSLEFLDELSRMPDEIRLRFTVLRLPMGTGNDGADGRVFKESLSRLIHGVLAVQPVLRVIPSGPAARGASSNEWRAFNIASVGLDAFVTHMTNKLKKIFPGNSYKFWIDIASILYDKLYPPQKLRLTVHVKGQKNIVRLEEKFLLIAMGISGRRTYGAGKAILPDDDNVCAVRHMSLFRKLAAKKPISSGAVRTIPEAVLFLSDKIEIQYSDTLLLQTDGESRTLSRNDFPVIIEKTSPLIRHIARA